MKFLEVDGQRWQLADEQDLADLRKSFERILEDDGKVFTIPVRSLYVIEGRAESAATKLHIAGGRIKTICAYEVYERS